MHSLWHIDARLFDHYKMISDGIKASHGNPRIVSTFSRGGLYCNHQDLSPKYAAALLGISNTEGALPGIFGVWLTGKLFDITGGNWGTSLFVPIAIAQALGFIVFSIYGSGEQIWD